MLSLSDRVIGIVGPLYRERLHTPPAALPMPLSSLPWSENDRVGLRFMTAWWGRGLFTIEKRLLLSLQSPGGWAGLD